MEDPILCARLIGITRLFDAPPAFALPIFSGSGDDDLPLVQEVRGKGIIGAFIPIDLTDLPLHGITDPLERKVGEAAFLAFEIDGGKFYIGERTKLKLELAQFLTDQSLVDRPFTRAAVAEFCGDNEAACASELQAVKLLNEAKNTQSYYRLNILVRDRIKQEYISNGQRSLLPSFQLFEVNGSIEVIFSNNTDDQDVIKMEEVLSKCKRELAYCLGVQNFNWRCLIASQPPRTSKFATTQQRARYINVSKALMQKMFQNEGYEFSKKNLKEALKTFQTQAVNGLYANIGRGFRSAREVFTAFFSSYNISPPKHPEEALGGTSINLGRDSSISGSFNKIEHFEQHIGSVSIAPGNPPEERARKKQQAERIIAEEVTGAIKALDDRLGFIDATLAADPFAAQLNAANEEIAPAASQSWGSNYRALIAHQRAASLRGAFNSRPLHAELRAPLLRQLEEVGTDPSAARSFCDALTAVTDKSEDLLALVADPASSDNTTINGRHLAIQRDTVRAASSWAYLTGLRLLKSLGVGTDPWVTAQLASLQQLEPQHFPDPAELRSLMDRAVQQAADAVHSKTALLEEARPLPEQDLKRFQEQTDEALRIKPDDPWNVVAGKAKSLRDLGRTEEAVRAYAAYAEMFAATDPTAERFSRTAQSFTQALGQLKVKGGVYIYALENAGGRRAGLLEGDIIITYGDHKVSDMVEFQEAYRERPPAPGLVVTFLRLLADGTFIRATATLTEASLGASLMPI
jgi:hypothetical protein